MRDDVKRLIYDADKYKTQEELDEILCEQLDLDRYPITRKEIKTLKGNRIKAIKRRTEIVEKNRAV
tara:strand:- start:522 stop:719 length:198 start_codon:yes stop_codon:yes gene_type:complete